MFVSLLFSERVSLAPRKRLASLSVCEAEGLESAMCAHRACILPHDATCDRGTLLQSISTL